MLFEKRGCSLAGSLSNQKVEWSSVNTPFVMFWGTIYDCQWSFEEKKKQIKSGKINGKGGEGKSGGRGVWGFLGKRSFTGFDLQQQWEGVDKEFFLRHWLIFIAMYTWEIQFDLTNLTKPFTDCLNRKSWKRLLNSLVQTGYPVYTYRYKYVAVSKRSLSKVNTTATNVVEQLWEKTLRENPDFFFSFHKISVFQLFFLFFIFFFSSSQKKSGFDRDWNQSGIIKWWKMWLKCYVFVLFLVSK